MATFSEVVRQFRRRCKEGCANCPLTKQQDNCWEYAAKNPAVFEEWVMDWAKAHPEPVYPTWIEWLREMKIVGSGFSVVPLSINDSIYAQIPEDIAKKLGLKPKEG